MFIISFQMLLRLETVVHVVGFLGFMFDIAQDVLTSDVPFCGMFASCETKSTVLPTDIKRSIHFT